MIPTSVNTDPFDGSKSLHSARRGAPRDLVGLASIATTPMGDFEPPKAELSCLLDSVANSLWYPRTIAPSAPHQQSGQFGQMGQY